MKILRLLSAMLQLFIYVENEEILLEFYRDIILDDIDPQKNLLQMDCEHKSLPPMTLALKEMIGDYRDEIKVSIKYSKLNQNIIPSIQFDMTWQLLCLLYFQS